MEAIQKPLLYQHTNRRKWCPKPTTSEVNRKEDNKFVCILYISVNIWIAAELLSLGAKLKKQNQKEIKKIGPREEK